jgi:hypothetical protein
MRYFAWALSHLGDKKNRVCPFCESPNAKLLQRKGLVTSLLECESCGLRFRIPKDDAQSLMKYYQEDYRKGFTTSLPDDATLSALVSSGFANSEKDFSQYIAVLHAAGLKRGDSILDFGCSWGYGSWQLTRAGFWVLSYEVSAPRAAFAREKLGCNVVSSLAEVKSGVKCFFSSHVIEHLPDPKIFGDAALSVLCSDGMVVCFCPNGDPASTWSTHYSDLWGKHHPLVLTPAFLRVMMTRYGFVPFFFSDPYELQAISRRSSDGVMSGEELCMVAYQRQYH